MRKAFPAALLAGLVLVACARQTRLESGGDVELGVTPADASSLPAGVALSVRLDEEIGTE